MKVKMCTKCNMIKSVMAFSVRPETRGFRSHCRDCVNSYGKAYRERVVQSRVAQRQARTAYEKQELIKPALCEKCQEEPPLDRHHDDYEKVCDIKWFCRKCHSEEHALTNIGVAVAE